MSWGAKMMKATLADGAVVFWGGAGRFGREVFRYCCVEEGCFPLPDCYCDRNSKLIGTSIEGRTVLSPEDVFALADKEYEAGRRTTVVICTKGFYTLQIVAELKRMEFEAKGNILLAEAIYAKTYTAHHKEEINAVAGMFADAHSQTLYRQFWHNLMHGIPLDFSLCSAPPYFGNDVIGALCDNEVFVDAGACDGEEIDRALRKNPRVHIIVFEPDPRSAKTLRKKYAARSNLTIHECALWNQEERLFFLGDCDTPRMSEINAAGDYVIHAVALDDVLRGENISLLKMDIEGAEYNALRGARNSIAKHLPKLAICVYHSIEDYVRIPQLIASWELPYSYYFRQHSATNTESVFYAIPR